jgi:Fe(3+) dicitrate transport protein
MNLPMPFKRFRASNLRMMRIIGFTNSLQGRWRHVPVVLGVCAVSSLARAEEAPRPQPVPAPLVSEPAVDAEPVPATPVTPEATDAPAEGGEALQVAPLTATGTWLGPPAERTVRTYAGARTVLDEKALSNSGARTLDDALRVVPGVRVQDESGTGLLPNIGMRGLSPARSEQVLVLVDGLPVSPAPYGQTGLSLFPVTLQTLEAVDVARGGIATHYGPNNVGGVINLVTKSIPTELLVAGRLGVAIGPQGMALGDAYARAGGFVSERIGVQLQANAIVGDSFRAHSHTRALNLLGDAEWRASEQLKVRAKLQYYQAGSDLPGALTPETYEQDPTRSQRFLDSFTGRALRGSVALTRKLGSGELNVTVFGHQAHRGFSFANPLNAGEAPTRLSTSPRDYTVLGTEVRHGLSFQALVPHEVTWGLRYLGERVDYLVDNKDLATDTLTVSRDWFFRTHAFAGYVSDTLALLDGALKVTPGLRFEHLELRHDDRLKGGRNHNATNDVLPGLSVGYQVARPLFLFGNYHRSFRPVQFTQITYGNELASEKANNLELGLRAFPLRWLDVGLTWFDIRFQNKLEFVDANTGFRNLGDARHQGLETSLGFHPLRSLDVRLAYTYLDATQRSGAFAGNVLPYASQHEGTFRVAYTRGTLTANVNGSCRSDAFSDAENTLEESANGSKGLVPGGCLANVHVSEQLRFEETTFRVGLGINNVLDARSFTRNVDYSLGRVPSPGRSVLVTLDFQR